MSGTLTTGMITDMKKWIGGTAAIWPDRSWQVYALPPAVVRDVAATYRPVVERFPTELSPVADEWLHMTVQPLPGWLSDYDDDRLDAVCRELRAAVADIKPPTTTVGPASCGSAGVVLDTDANEDHPLTRLFGQVRTTVAVAAGVPPGSGWPGHLSLGYATNNRDSGEIQSPLRRQRSGPIRAEWTISSLFLCDVRQDPHEHTYTWSRPIEIPIGTSESLRRRA